MMEFVIPSEARDLLFVAPNRQKQIPRRYAPRDDNVFGMTTVYRPYRPRAVSPRIFLRNAALPDSHWTEG